MAQGYVAANRNALARTPSDLVPVDWFDCCLPSDDQGRLNACVGHGTGNWFVAIIRRKCGLDAIPLGYSFDGELLWRMALEADGRAGQNEGLASARDCFVSAKKLGIITGANALIEIGPACEGINLSLRETPLVCGIHVHAGWFDDAVNKETGQVGEALGPSVLDLAGHCMLMAADIRHPVSGRWAYMWQNSWTQDYGYHGFALSSHDEFLQCYMGDGPWTVANYDPVNNRTWEKYIVKDPTRGTL